MHTERSKRICGIVNCDSLGWARLKGTLTLYSYKLLGVFSTEHVLFGIRIKVWNFIKKTLSDFLKEVIQSLVLKVR